MTPVIRSRLSESRQPVMDKIRKIEQGVYSLYVAGTHVEPSSLVQGFLSKGTTMANKGRGSLTTFTVGGQRIACRKYVHGGLLRALTRDLFLSGKRALQEMDILLYLIEEGFPVVQPLGVIVEGHGIIKHPSLLTVFAENTVDSLEYIRGSSGKERLRMIRTLAYFLWRLAGAGVYHPDFHLRNVLVTPGKDLLFLDFDRARRKRMALKDAARVFWRLNRYAEKMERMHYVSFTIKEKMLFVRTYDRLTGYRVGEFMAKRARFKRLTSRIGWAIESLFYGGLQ
jgi:hypothetical protein